MEEDEKNNENWVPTAINSFTGRVVNVNEYTLRDQLAMAALTGLVCSMGPVERVEALDGASGGRRISVAAYMYADAMLAAREAG